MLSLLNSKMGNATLRNVIFLLIVIIGLVVLVQWTRTKILVEEMRSVVKENAVGAKIRASWDDIIYENILIEAEANGIITIEELNSGKWDEKMELEIYRPTRNRIEITLNFTAVTNYFITKKVKYVSITEKAEIYDM